MDEDEKSPKRACPSLEPLPRLLHESNPMRTFHRTERVRAQVDLPTLPRPPHFCEAVKTVGEGQAPAELHENGSTIS